MFEGSLVDRRASLETGAGQAHGHAVIGQDADTVGIGPDQGQQPLADLVRRVAVEGQRHDAGRWYSPHPQQVSDAMHDHTCLAGARPSQHQPIYVVIVGDYQFLSSAQRLDNRFP